MMTSLSFHYLFCEIFLPAVDIVERGRTQQRTKDPVVSPARAKYRKLQPGLAETQLEDDLEEKSLASVLNLAQQQLELEAQVGAVYIDKFVTRILSWSLPWSVSHSVSHSKCFTKIKVKTSLFNYCCFFFPFFLAFY